MSAHVLLVEDERVNRRLISLFLEREGLRVTTAANGNEGISCALSEDFDLILFDLNLPKLDGTAAIQRLREQGVTTPIIVVSATHEKAKIDQCFELGCSDFIQKPFEREEFISCLVKHLPQAVACAEEETFSEEEDEHFTIESAAVLEAYTEKLHLRLSALEESVKERDYDSLREHAHRLACAGLFQHPRIGEQAQYIERLCAEKSYDAIPSAFAELKETIERSIKESQAH